MGVSSPINSTIPAVFVITRDYIGIVATTAMSSPSAPAIAVHIDSVGECAFLISPCSHYLAKPLISERLGLLCIDRIFPHLFSNKHSHFGWNARQADFQFANNFLFCLACTLRVARCRWFVLAAQGTQ